MAGTGVFPEFEWRGLVHQTTDPALGAMLAGETVTAYAGFDPTGNSLHLGHLVGIVGLMRLERAGHRPIALAGGATGMIGDPSFKSDERQLLTPEALAANTAAIREQLGRFLDFGSSALLVDNSEWLGAIGLLPFLRDVGKHFTVNAMVAKDSVRARLEDRDQGISFTEFSYMLLQAYDFQCLFDTYGCRLQLGGSDQWGNITAGIDLIRRRHGATAYGMTWPLVTNPDGTKFGKTESGTNVWLDGRRTSPYAMYQFLVRTADDMVGRYLRYFTFRTRDDIEALDVATESSPGRREAQRALALDVVSMVHGADEAARAVRASQVLFSEEIASLDESTLMEVIADVPSSTLARAEVLESSVLDLLVNVGLSASRGAARRVIEQGGAYVNNRKVVGVDEMVGALLHDRYVVLRQGQRNQHVIVAS